MKLTTRTDLALEEFSSDSAVEKNERTLYGCKVTSMNLTDEQAKLYKKNGGLYYTIETKAFKELNHDDEEKVIKVIQRVINELLEALEIDFNKKIFVVGLGNTQITPDSLGPLVVEKLIVTSHLEKANMLEDNYRSVSCLAPGVMGQTGIETSDIITSIVKKEKPDLVVVIDALAARSIKRVNQSIQITTSGINPGSGVLNKRKSITEKTLGTKLIAIGVPTVVDVVNITADVFEHLKRINTEHVDALENKFLESLASDETFDFFVTPKEIDQNIEELASVISRALNISFHNLQ